MSVSAEYSVLTLVIVAVAIIAGGAALIHSSQHGSSIGFAPGSVIVEEVGGYVIVKGIVSGDARASICELEAVWNTPNGTITDRARVETDGTLRFSLFGPGGRVKPTVVENGSQLSLMVSTRGWKLVSVTLYLCREDGGRTSLSVPVG